MGLASKTKVGFLLLSFCLIFLLALSPPASAEEVHRKELQYIIKGQYSIIEGYVFDSKTGDPVVGASITGEIHSEKKRVDVLVNENGYFIVEILEEGDHDYILNVCAVGYESVALTGSIKSGEHKSLRVSIDYNPFDLRLSESSGSLTRGYKTSSYSLSRLVPFTAQRTVQVLDSNGQPVYDTVEEKKLVGYVWEQLVTSYRLEKYTVGIPTLVPKFRTERYISGWTSFRVGRLMVRIPIFSTRQVFDGYTLKLVPQTFTRLVPYEQWVTKSSSTPDFYANPVTKALRDDVRNLKVIYTTTIRRIPRTITENYTSYRVYNYTGTIYSFLPWDSKQVIIHVIPKNGYTATARLDVIGGDGVVATLSPSLVELASATTATLNLAPVHASSNVVRVRAYDFKGRLVDSHSYSLNLTESLPSDSYSWTFARITESQYFIAPAKVTTSTSVEGISVSTSTESRLAMPQIINVDTGWHSQFFAPPGSVWTNETGTYLNSGGSWVQISDSPFEAPDIVGEIKLDALYLP